MPITLGIVGVTSRNFTNGRSLSPAQGDNIDTNVGRGAPNKIWEGQKRPKFGTISDIFQLWARMDPHNENQKSTWSTTSHPLLGEKNMVNFDPLTKKL